MSYMEPESEYLVATARGGWTDMHDTLICEKYRLSRTMTYRPDKSCN